LGLVVASTVQMPLLYAPMVVIEVFLQITLHLHVWSLYQDTVRNKRIEMLHDLFSNNINGIPPQIVVTETRTPSTTKGDTEEVASQQQRRHRLSSSSYNDNYLNV